jgi:hypothetical protein
MVRDSFDSVIEEDFAARLGDDLGEFLRHEFEIGDAGGGHMNPAQTRGVRFDFTNLPGFECANAGYSVLATAPQEFMQSGKLPFLRSHDNLAADFVRKAVLAAKRNHGVPAFHAQTGFQRSGFVVQAGMNHATVVAGLVSCDFPLLIERKYIDARKPANELEACGKTDNARPDDRNVTLFVPRGRHDLSPKWAR